MTVTDEWRRLAELLRYTRVVVLGQRSRAAFARSLGLSNDRVLNDLENASRCNYEPDTLLSIEKWYGLSGDTLRSILGEAYPMHEIRTVASEHVIDSARATHDETIEDLQASIDEITTALAALQERIGQLRE